MRSQVLTKIIQRREGYCGKLEHSDLFALVLDADFGQLVDVDNASFPHEFRVEILYKLLLIIWMRSDPIGCEHTIECTRE